jgi:hypothetical protein
VKRCNPIFSLYPIFIFVVGRPEPTAYLLKRRRQVFKKAKREIDTYTRLLGAATTLEDSDEDQQDISEEAKLDVQNELAEEAKLDVQNEMPEEIDGIDDDVTRKDSFYNTAEDGDKIADSRLPPATVGFLLFIVFMAGLAVTWYSREMQRRRSGLRKKLDVYR